MKYPAITLFDTSVTRSGRKLTRVLREFYPGPINHTADIVFQWGQSYPLNPKKKTVVFDCGYFFRDLSDGERRHYRFSVNTYHPTNLPQTNSDRWDKLGLKLESLYCENGPIILVGRGGKTRANQGSNALDWELQTLKKIQKAFPAHRIIYRPKNRGRRISNETLPGVRSDATSTVRGLCEGASLIVTQSSNIGNEGLLYGIPVVTEGGPASDICGSAIKPGLTPLSVYTRQSFLHRLAYCQWSLAEIKSGEIWPWLFRCLEYSKK